MTKLIPELTDNIKSFSYVFTHFPKDISKKIPASLANLIKYLSDNEKSDKAYFKFLKQMKKKSKAGDPAVVIDLVKDVLGGGGEFGGLV